MVHSAVLSSENLMCNVLNCAAFALCLAFGCTLHCGILLLQIICSIAHSNHTRFTCCTAPLAARGRRHNSIRTRRQGSSGYILRGRYRTGSCGLHGIWTSGALTGIIHTEVPHPHRAGERIEDLGGRRLDLYEIYIII